MEDYVLNTTTYGTYAHSNENPALLSEYDGHHAGGG